MAQRQARRPVPGPRAFAEQGRNARLSQAAIVLSVGAAARGEPDRVDSPEEIGLPADVARLGRTELIPVAEAAEPLGIDLSTHLTDRSVRVGPSTTADLMTRLLDDPEPVGAAALVEANLHSDSRLVRTAAAVAAIDTTGPRDDVVAQLVEGATRGDRLTREIGRIGLARVDPQHAVLSRLVGSPSPMTGTDRPSHTAVLTHGTFASRAQWWQPGGDFYDYLNGLVPPLKLHDPSFRWSGAYSEEARQLAAQQMVAWVTDQNLQQPDVFAHSHGGTVANLATRLGLQIDRLVLLSWPARDRWFPEFANVRRIIDIRVRGDLVILADLGRQTFNPPPEHANKVETHVNGWFEHSDTHEPDYWEQYDLPDEL
jgi:pimeloyl-ACP methyl ester carboxylesterase